MALLSAEEVVDKLKRNRSNKIELTTNQIRKFLAGVNAIYNRILAYQGEGKIVDDTLPEDIIAEISYIKVKLIYQSGREQHQAVKNFMEIAEIEKRLDHICSSKSKKEFIEFNRFIEGIVAYHKYMGGK